MPNLIPAVHWPIQECLYHHWHFLPRARPPQEGPGRQLAGVLGLPHPGPAHRGVDDAAPEGDPARRPLHPHRGGGGPGDVRLWHPLHRGDGHVMSAPDGGGKLQETAALPQNTWVANWHFVLWINQPGFTIKSLEVAAYLFCRCSNKEVAQVGGYDTKGVKGEVFDTFLL